MVSCGLAGGERGAGSEEAGGAGPAEVRAEAEVGGGEGGLDARAQEPGRGWRLGLGGTSICNMGRRYIAILSAKKGIFRQMGGGAHKKT